MMTHPKHTHFLIAARHAELRAAWPAARPPRAAPPVMLRRLGWLLVEVGLRLSLPRRGRLPADDL